MPKLQKANKEILYHRDVSIGLRHVLFLEVCALDLRKHPKEIGPVGVPDPDPDFDLALAMSVSMPSLVL